MDGSAKLPGCVIEDGVSVAHEELPLVVQRVRSADRCEVLAVNAVAECGCAAGAWMNVCRRAQPDSLGCERRGCDLGPVVCRNPTAAEGKAIDHGD